MVRFSGYLSDESAAQARTELEAWLIEQGLTPDGEPVAAQYDGPSRQGFARRNEILIPVTADSPELD